MLRIGVISDTHRLLRPEAVAALAGSDLIVHAGDIGSNDVVDALGELAPTTAIRGNVDRDAWALAYPEEATLEVADRRIHVIHDRSELSFDPVSKGVDVVVSGHSHKPGIEEIDGVVYLNPGSAGPRRFSLPVAVAELALRPDRIDARIVELEI